MYSIIREKGFDLSVEELTQTYSRMDDLDNAIDWALSKNPFAIPNTVDIGNDFRVWVTEEFFNMDIPMVRILYKADTNKKQVYLISIEEAIQEDEPVFLDLK